MRTDPERAHAVQSVSAPRPNGTIITKGHTNNAIRRGLNMNLFALPIVKFEVKIVSRLWL